MEILAVTARNLFGISLTEKQILALETCAGELADWNQRVNLTAITDREGAAWRRSPSACRRPNPAPASA